MADAKHVNLGCGFCLSEDIQMKDPRTLPCNHVHCFECLVGNVGINKVLRCPFCKEVFDLAVDSLPSITTTKDESINCDSCDRKGVKEPAIMYCTVCSTKHCAKHKEMHDELHGGHNMITMSEYRTQARRLEPRYCTQHSKMVYSMGCRECHVLACLQCVDILDKCSTTGSSHKLMFLDKLVDELSKEINGLRDQVVQREEELSSLFKQTSRIISDYDVETEEMVECLHKRKDEEMKAIELKYTQLEVELVELRNMAKDEMRVFMEDVVGAKWCDLSNHRDRIDSRLSSSHKVDVVSGHSHSMDEVKRLTSDVLPQVELQNLATLQISDTKAEIVRTYGVIDSRNGLTTRYLPKSMTLTQTVNMSTYCDMVTSYHGNTYVGIENYTVAVIDEKYQLKNTFLSFNNRVYSVRVHNDRVYTLVYGNPYTVHVHDIDGKPITNWTHADSTSHYNQLSFVANQIVLPDRKNKRLTVYSLTGEVVKHIPCPLLTNSVLATCFVDEHSIIVSDYGSSQVFKVDISVGSVCWTSKHVTKPEGVTYYRGAAYVTCAGFNVQVYVLDVKTGELLTQISDPTARSNSDVFDLCISGKTLIVPRYGERKVLFYLLD